MYINGLKLTTEWSKHVAMLSFANSRVGDVCQRPGNKHKHKGEVQCKNIIFPLGKTMDKFHKPRYPKPQSRSMVVERFFAHGTVFLAARNRGALIV